MLIHLCVCRMDSLDFSEDEIQEQLAVLGYRNIPQHRLREFKRGVHHRAPSPQSVPYHTECICHLSQRVIGDIFMFICVGITYHSGLTPNYSLN